MNTDHDYDQDYDQAKPGRFHEENYNPFKKSSPAMESAAMVLAILSLVFCWIIYLAVPMAAVSIVLALLSRGSGRIAKRVKTTVIIAGAGMIISSAVTGVSVYRVFTTPELRAQMEELMEYYAGLSLDDYLAEDSSEAQPGEQAQGAAVDPDSLLQDLLSGEDDGGDFL